MPKSYFETLPAATIANHLLCVYASKTFAKLSGSTFTIDVRRELDQSALYICHSTATMSKEDQILPPSYEIERCAKARAISSVSNPPLTHHVCDRMGSDVLSSGT